jgi:prophage regulatory protein
MRQKLAGLDGLTKKSRATGRADLATASDEAAAWHPTRIIRVRELCARTGLSRTTLWRMERRGDFPSRRQLSPGTVGWMESEIEAWLVGRIRKSGR